MASARRVHDGAFTPPQFPLDPFNAIHGREPWFLDPSTLPTDSLLTSQRKVILVLGEPSLDSIAPLLYSPHLSSSLLILATSRSYVIQPQSIPAVRILRLGVSLAASNSAASRLVAILQWAESVASTWRAHSSPPRLEELSEDGPTAGYLTPPQRLSWFGSSSTPPSPTSSSLSLSQSSPRSPSRLSTKRRSTMSIAPTISPKTDVTERDMTRRAFDALFDFLPPDASDRQLLKYAILVTTVARPLLTCHTPAPPPPPKPSKRFSLRGRPSASPPACPAPPTHVPAHIVHLVPAARTTLIHPLESFCLNYSYPNTSRSAPTLSLPAEIDLGDPGPLPRPYVLPPTVLGDVLHTQRKWTLAELILSGALDGDSAASTPHASLRSLAKSNRAWISGIGDLVLETGHKRDRRVMGDAQRSVPAAPTLSEPAPARVSPVEREDRTSRRPLLHVQPRSLHRPAGEWQRQQPPPPSPSTSHRARSHAASSSAAPLVVSDPSSSSSSHESERTTTQPADSAMWPTPPSSTSSSPELSTVKGKGKGKALAHEEDMQEHGVKSSAFRSIGMLATSRDRGGGGSGSSADSMMSRRRKALVAWLKR